jgi:drug/metabolite transporter (DMT)-like permease
LSLLFAAGRSDHPELAVVCASASGAVTVILARIVSRERILPLRWLGIAMTFAGIGLLSAVN